MPLWTRQFQSKASCVLLHRVKGIVQQKFFWIVNGDFTAHFGRSGLKTQTLKNFHRGVWWLCDLGFRGTGSTDRKPQCHINSCLETPSHYRGLWGTARTDIALIYVVLPSLETPGENIDQNIEVCMGFRPLRPKWTIPPTIMVQDMRFNW